MANYTMTNRGQITKYEAGVFYRNYKNSNIQAYPELASTLYDQAKLSIRFARERYQQNARFYDAVEQLTIALLDEDYEKAQTLVNKIQERQIADCTKKSNWFKYKNETSQ